MIGPESNHGEDDLLGRLVGIFLDGDTGRDVGASHQTGWTDS